MKKVIIHCFFMMLIASIIFSQESKNRDTAKPVDGKKSLDAFINATTKSYTETPVAGANIILELSPQKKGTVTTNREGAFGVNFSNIDEVQGKNNPTITLLATINPSQEFQYQYKKRDFKLSLNKSEGPYYEFTLLFQSKDGSNSGEFIIKPNKIHTIIMAPDTTKKGAKQGKGSAVKTGDSYQGEVMHF